MFIQSLRISIHSVLVHKLRSALSILGVVVGIAAVSVTMSILQAMEKAFQSQLSSLGTNVVYVSRTPWLVLGDWWKYRNRPLITLYESKKLLELLDSKVVAVIPVIGTLRSVKFQSEILENIPLIGTTENQILIQHDFPEFGRFLTEMDVVQYRRVCVIGYEVREKLFGPIDPIGKRIKIGGLGYRVVGVMEKQGAFLGSVSNSGADERIWIPITTFMKNFGKLRNIDIAVKAHDSDNIDDIEEEVIYAMRRIRGLTPRTRNDFSVNRQNVFTNFYNNTIGLIGTVGIVITSISLFVGSIGIMNVMYVSINERTSEIGICKAVGAKKRNIFIQFLFEAIIIALTGSILGVIIAFFANLWIEEYLPTQLSYKTILFSIIAASAVGLVSGVLPAIKASRLNPIDALRYE